MADAITAIRRGGIAVIPTDTVYGLTGAGQSEAAARAVYALKGRSEIQPTALVFSSSEALFAHLPELGDRERAIAHALLPGPFTLVVANPARRFAWLTGSRPDAIGVRVPALAGPGREVLDGVGVVVATSANLPGGRDPRSLHEVPSEILTGADAAVDGGLLPGRPSTVLDVTGAEVTVIREGAVPADEALERVRAALTGS